jgi:hypothetical protein
MLMINTLRTGGRGSREVSAGGGVNATVGLSVDVKAGVSEGCGVEGIAGAGEAQEKSRAASKTRAKSDFFFIL